MAQLFMEWQWGARRRYSQGRNRFVHAPHRWWVVVYRVTNLRMLPLVIRKSNASRYSRRSGSKDKSALPQKGHFSTLSSMCRLTGRFVFPSLARFRDLLRLSVLLV